MAFRIPGRDSGEHYYCSRLSAVFQKEKMAIIQLLKGERDDQKDDAGEGWKQIHPI